MAEEKRDMLDEIIDFRRDLKAVQNPLDSITGALIQDPDNVPTWNPGEYKERPRGNAQRCARIKSGNDAACSVCLDVCPVNAISFTGGRIDISQDCRKCGLCMSMCPAEAFTDHQHLPKRLYDTIAKVAEAHKKCYLTCTRALGRLPEANEVVLPCVGAVPAEALFAVIAAYPNVEVYLPFGICDRCRTTTGEEVYVDHIGQAEEWSGFSVGLEVEETNLNHEQTRAYKRGQFVQNMARAGQNVLLAGNPTLLGAKAVAARIKRHTQKVNDMQKALEEAVGGKTSSNRRHMLTQSRKLMLSTIQDSPVLANVFDLEVPVCDSSLCSMCGECVRVCPVHACDLDQGGHFSVEPAYCLNCGACVRVCEDEALRMEPVDPAELVVPDPNAEKYAEQRAKVQKAKAEGREKLKKTLDALGRLVETDEA